MECSIVEMTYRKQNGSIDSLQVHDTTESIQDLQKIGVSAKQSKEYDDEIDIQSVENNPRFLEWLNKEHISLKNYPRLRRYLKS